MLNETDANDDGDDDATPHFTACVVLCAHFITLTLAQVRALPALHSRPSS